MICKIDFAVTLLELLGVFLGGVSVGAIWIAQLRMRAATDDLGEMTVPEAEVANIVAAIAMEAAKPVRP